MRTDLYSDPIHGTKIELREDDLGVELRIVVHYPPFAKRTIALDLDDVDRLLALREHSGIPYLDLAEHFQSAYHIPESAAQRAAAAFIQAAPSLAETIY